MISNVGGSLGNTWKNNLIPLRHRRTPYEFTLAAHLALTGLLSVVIVLIGYSYALAPSAAALNKLADSGTLFLSSSELVTHAKIDHSSGYWLGPKEGNIFLLNDDESGTDKLTYLPEGARLSASPSQLLTIATYDDNVSFVSKSHGLNSDLGSQFATNGGRTVRFNLATMKDEIVTIPGKPQIVVITYPTAQTAETLRLNAGRLQLIQ